MYPQHGLIGDTHSKYVSTHSIAGSAIRVLRGGRERERGGEGEREREREREREEGEGGRREGGEGGR